MRSAGVAPAGVALLMAACGPQSAPAPAAAPLARHLVLVTIDTLRADRVGAYACPSARTPTLDGIAREGARFEQAFATAPITLTSHASLLTGLYPPGHGARHNGIRLSPGTPTLASRLRAEGFATAAFVAAFPLDRRFGLDAGFEVYGDRLPRQPDGRPGVERPGREVVDEAISWWRGADGRRRFLWVHLFEPHAPYGGPGRDTGRPVIARYDDEVATADREAGRLLAALGDQAGATLVVAASDHGESFGEHGEVAHSLFVYDTTLRVPLVMRGPGVPPGTVVHDAVALVDVAPTAARLLGTHGVEADGIDLTPAFRGGPLPARRLYAESFAPLLDFGWSPLRAVRSGRWKAIAAPRPELYDLAGDPGEERDLAVESGKGPQAETLRLLLARIEAYGPAALPRAAAPSPASSPRLAALGYLQGGRAAAGTLPDPKDRKHLAARIAMAVSGEVSGNALLQLLGSIVGEDPANGQARQRLGYALLEAGRPREAEAHFRAAIDAGVPPADACLGLAVCLGRRGAAAEAFEALRRADAAEPGNPVVLANIGIAAAALSQPAEAVAALEAALAIDPDLHEARFNLALALARAGDRARASSQVDELLRRLPPSAAQRGEVERLREALR